MPSDFLLNPDYQFETTTKYKTAVTEFENGAEQRRALWGTKLREWRLEYKNRTSTDRDTILTLFNAKLGALSSFTWTNPDDSATYTVRFKDDSLVWTCDVFGLYNISFSLVEIK